MSKLQKILFIPLLSILIFTIILSIFKLNSKNKIQEQQIEKNTQNITEDTISWQEATNLIQDCQIKVIFQSRNKEITLRDKQNNIFYSTEPEFDDVVKIAKDVQGPCDIIQTVTE